MKFLRKIFYLIIIIISLINIIFTEKELSNYNNQKSPNNGNSFFKFKEEKSLSKDDDLNIFIINTENLNSKTAANRDDYEQEVIPSRANAGSYYSWGFAWWTFLSFPPENAIFGRSSSYWLSKNGQTEDYIELYFDVPTKLDNMLIDWRLSPTSFKVEFRVHDGGALIPLTKKILKFEKINKNGTPGNLSQVSQQNALIFQKPIFAKSIKISMWDPLLSHKFSINKVRFFNIRTTMMIINQTVDPCKQYCLYINTNLPTDGTPIEAMECLSGMSTADNRELFQYWADRSVRYYITKQCVGFDGATHDLILKDCSNYTPYTIITNTDNSLSFQGYESMCISLDTSKNQSANFVNENTNLKVSSEYDNGLYKKENMLSK